MIRSVHNLGRVFSRSEQRRVATFKSSVLLIAVFATTCAFATTYAELTLDELTTRAETAFYGAVSEVNVEERDGDPYTLVTFDVTRGLTGEPGETLELAFLGGDLPDGTSLVVTGMPQFDLGDEVILFAYDTPYYSPIVGFSQGLWRLSEEGFRDETGRVLSLNEAGELVRDGAGAGTDALLNALATRFEGPE